MWAHHYRCALLDSLAIFETETQLRELLTLKAGRLKCRTVGEINGKSVASVTLLRALLGASSLRPGLPSLPVPGLALSHHGWQVATIDRRHRAV